MEIRLKKFVNNNFKFESKYHANGGNTKGKKTCTIQTTNPSELVIDESYHTIATCDTMWKHIYSACIELEGLSDPVDNK